MTFRTFNLYLLSFSSGNTNFLSTTRAGINMMCFSLLHHIFLSVKLAADFLSISQIFLIFRISCRDISGKYSEICINDKNKSNCIQNTSGGILPQKRTHNNDEKCHTILSTICQAMGELSQLLVIE